MLIDTPFQPGFGDKLGVDVSGSPMTEVIRKCRGGGYEGVGEGDMGRVLGFVGA